jgi:hypothetical protein
MSVAQRHDKEHSGRKVIMQGPATTLPAKGIAQNCSIVIFGTAVDLAMTTPSVSPATISGDPGI